MDVFIALNAVLGLIVGSFLNVVVLRHNTGRTLTGRSACFSCGTSLTVWQLIPVVSWVAQRGRCAFCGSRISIQYPLVELAAGVLFTAVAGAGLPILAHGTALLIASVLIAIVAYDIRHTIIPDAWAYLFAVLALVYAALMFPLSAWPLHLFAGPLAAIPLAVLWYVSGGRWMGLGDAKLALGIGWLLGAMYGLIAVFAAFVIGALVSVFVLLPLPYIVHGIRRFIPSRVWHAPHAGFTMKSEVPFGPFLVSGCIIVWLMHMYSISMPFLIFTGMVY